MAGREKDNRTKVKSAPSALAKATNAARAEQKKRRVQPVNAEKRRGRMKEYFKGVKVETKKVVWPTRRELISYTILVFAACAFFGLMIWGVDTAFLAALKQLLGISL
ncbi:MAG: preprotein translocase subunit SecE [Clostridiales Family XIII bacterium]|jgi:preprotein translocase subunit SecE|nr:preprotein translocase subunit SecE [Clostridiales Family XIII bacterium]